MSDNDSVHAKARLCPRCGARVEADTPRSLCAVCLLRLGFDETMLESSDEAALSPAPSAGRRIGHYELLEELGRGGLGVVWRARHVALDRVVALKLLRLGPATSEADLKRFRTEAEAAASLQHPHIVPLHEVGEHDGQPYLVLGLIEGGTLAAHLTKHERRNTPYASARLIAVVARAVHHAHQRGILHRDLKPSNILLDAEGRPHVTDFGLAKFVVPLSDGSNQAGPAKAGIPDALTLTGAVLGTPDYMAPEQALGRTKALTTATDVYSLGAILYELLAGQPPFTGASPLEILRKVIEEEPVSPSHFRRSSRREEAQLTSSPVFAMEGRAEDKDPFTSRSKPDQSLLTSAATIERIDRDLETICLKCLEKLPAARYGSAEALAEDLERWLRHEPIRARRTSAVERLVKWVRRRPALAAATALALFAVATGLGGVLWQWRRAEHHAALARQRADDNQERSRRLQMAGGLQYLEAGDHFAALLSFTEAFALDAARPEREANHRTTLAAVQAQAPRLLHAWFLGGWLRHAEFSTNGLRLLLVSDGEGARVFDASTGRALTAPLPHDGPAVKARLTADGQRVLSVAGGIARVWAVESGELVRQFAETGLRSADLTPDGRRVVLLTAGHDFLIRDVATGEPVAPAYHAASGWLNFRLGSDGRRLVGFADEDFEIVDAETARPLTPRLRRRIALREERLRLMSFNGRQALSIEADNRVVPRNAADGRPVGAAFTPPEKIGHAVLSEDGQHAATSGEGYITRVWDTATGRMLGQLPRGNSVVLANAFSPDARRLVCHSGASGEAVRVWDIATARALTPPLRHAGFVSVAVFSPDGRHLLTGGADGVARLWALDRSAGLPTRSASPATEGKEVRESSPNPPAAGRETRAPGNSPSPHNGERAGVMGENSTTAGQSKEPWPAIDQHEILSISHRGTRLITRDATNAVVIWRHHALDTSSCAIARNRFHRASPLEPR